MRRFSRLFDRDWASDQSTKAGEVVDLQYFSSCDHVRQIKLGRVESGNDVGIELV